MPSYYHITDIDWDYHHTKHLPKELRIDRQYEPDAHEDTIADFLSDKYGYCINGCDIEEKEYETTPTTHSLIKKTTYNEMKDKIKKLEEDNEKLKEIPKISMEDAEGDEAMAMCMSLTEKFHKQLEDITDDFEKTMKDVVCKLWDGFDIDLKYDIETNEINVEDNKPFPMDKVKKFIYKKLDRWMIIREKVEDGVLMERDEWEDEYDFDIDEAGEILEEWENGDLIYRNLNDRVVEEKQKLKEEVEKLKEEIKKLQPSMKGCELPFPPPKMRDGVWEEGCESVAREEEITKEYISQYGHPSLSSIKYFVDNYEGENSMVATIKKWLDNDEKLIYGSFTKLLDNACDKEKSIEVGEHIYNVLLGTGEVHKHMEAMRCCYYLVCWFMRQSNNMCIGSYGRMVEHYWDGIGEWLA
tara:strand:+ start:1099 stop:2334 length:1236 start_codon:yes stop_codon:yes gene_type:complete